MLIECEDLILGKRVFVPFVDGPAMVMVETPNPADLRTFRANSWSIPEPPSINGRAKGINSSISD